MPAISAQFFSSVHVIFTIKYLHASIRIPLLAELNAELEKKEKKVKKEIEEGEKKVKKE